MIGMHSFGASAPAKDVQKKFGFTVEHVVRGSARGDCAIQVASLSQVLR